MHVIPWLLPAGLLVLGAHPTPQEEWVVSLLDGRQVSGRVVAWQPKGGLQLLRPDDSALHVPTAEVDHVETTRPSFHRRTDAWKCLLVDGSLLLGTMETSRTEDRVLLRGQAGLFPELPLDVIRVIARADADLGGIHGDANQDTVALESGETVRGTLQRLDAAGVHVEDGAGDRSIAWRAVREVRLAPSTAAAGPASIARVELVGGSGVTVSDFDWRAGRVKLNLPVGGAFSVTPQDVIGIETQTPRRLWLGDVAAQEYTATSFLDKSWPLRVDRSALGEPLRLQGRCHRRGIGLHSACRATWAVPHGAARFRTSIGIDDSAGAQADADVRIFLDGHLEVEHRGLRAGQNPRPVDMNVSGKSSLTIEVGFGQHGHVQDRVDLLWAEWILDPKRK